MNVSLYLFVSVLKDKITFLVWLICIWILWVCLFQLYAVLGHLEIRVDNSKFAYNTDTCDQMATLLDKNAGLNMMPITAQGVFVDIFV